LHTGSNPKRQRGLDRLVPDSQPELATPSDTPSGEAPAAEEPTPPAATGWLRKFLAWARMM
jgi:hypothetical protein